MAGGKDMGPYHQEKEKEVQDITQLQGKVAEEQGFGIGFGLGYVKE